jgi:hypothetical protein
MVRLSELIEGSPVQEIQQDARKAFDGLPIDKRLRFEDAKQSHFGKRASQYGVRSQLDTTHVAGTKDCDLVKEKEHPFYPVAFPPSPERFRVVVSDLVWVRALAPAPHHARVSSTHLGQRNRRA